MKNQFDTFFIKIFGAERWPKIKEAMLKPDVKTAFVNPWCSPGFRHQMLSLAPGEGIPRDPETGLLGVYFLDPASLVVASKVKWSNSHQRVLDMCAAPGGKSLAVLASLNSHHLIEFIANEMSQSRRERLTKVIQNYIPKDLRTKVWVKGLAGEKWGRKSPETYDAILLDAPCSGERHHFQEQLNDYNWTESASQKLSKIQSALLYSAFDSLLSGGRIVYSTCSLSPYENDEVVKKFLQSKGSQASVQKEISSGEQTEFGNLILPDANSGAGPMYYSVITKN